MRLCSVPVKIDPRGDGFYAATACVKPCKHTGWHMDGDGDTARPIPTALRWAVITGVFVTGTLIFIATVTTV